MEKKSAPNVKI